MTARWTLSSDVEGKFNKRDISYAKFRSVTEASAVPKDILRSPAAFANMCLMSGDFDCTIAFGGMYGALILVAGSKNVEFIENEMLTFGVRLENVYISSLHDLNFGDKPLQKRKSMDLTKAYYKWIEEPSQYFNDLHNRRLLVHLGIALCTMGKDITTATYSDRWLLHWISTLSMAYGINTPILIDELPSKSTMQGLYAFFATHRSFRAKLMSLILKYANKTQDHPFRTLCRTVARLLKFSEMEHICMVIEHIGGVLSDKSSFLVSADPYFKYTCNSFLSKFNDMRDAMPDFETNYKYGMLLYPDIVEPFVRDVDNFGLVFIALHIAKNRAKAEVCSDIIDLAYKYVCIVIENVEDLVEFMGDVLLHYTNICLLYEAIDIGHRRKRTDLIYKGMGEDSGNEIIVELLELCGTKESEVSNDIKFMFSLFESDKK